MDFGKMFSRAFGIVTFKREASRETAEDPGALVPALLLVLVAALVGGLVSGATGEFVAQMMNQPSMGTGMVQALAQSFGGALIGLFLVPGLLLVIGKLFGSKAEYMGLVKAYGHAAGILGFLAVIPCAGGIIALIWTIAANVPMVAELGKLETGKAVGTALIAWAIVLVVGCGIAMAVGFSQAAAQGAFG
jgi:hypothetical protein